jgi:probable F420-dependent oxidoreductase
MKIGLCLPTLESPDQGYAPSYSELREMALRAEEAGIDSLWLFDHLLYQRFDGAPVVSVWECWTLLPALAEVTRRIGLGTLVTCTQYRNPALLAKMAASLDEISQGRFTLGLGAGWHEPEFSAFGFPFDHRVSRFEEALQIIRPLLKEGRVDFAGRYYQARRCELRPRGPSGAGSRGSGVPILVGGTGPRMLSLTATYADVWNTGYVSTLDTLTAKQAALREACTMVGRDPATLPLTVHLPLVYEDLAPAPPFLAEYLSGFPQEFAECLRAFERAGVSHVMVECFPAGRLSVERLAGLLANL